MEEELSRVELMVLAALTIKGGRGSEALTFSFEKGWHHPSLRELNLRSEDVEAALKNLINKGLIVKELVMKSVSCPSCRSFKVLTFYVCPSCGFRNIEKDAVLEHLICGTIGRRELFKSNGKLKCPTCKRELRALGVDYTIVGAWFKCPACGKTFEMPGIAHRCVACGLDFDYRDSIYEEVNTYTVTPKGVEAAKRAAFIYAVEKAAEKTGFTVEFNGRIKGLSGVEHRFEFVLRKGKHTVTIDLLFSGRAVTSLLVSTLAKLYDTPFINPIIVMIPTVPAEAKTIADRYNATLIEGATPDELSLTLENTLKKYVS